MELTGRSVKSLHFTGSLPPWFSNFHRMDDSGLQRRILFLFALRGRDAQAAVFDLNLRL